MSARFEEIVRFDRLCDCVGEYLPIAVMLIAAVFIGFCAGVQF